MIVSYSRDLRGNTDFKPTSQCQADDHESPGTLGLPLAHSLRPEHRSRRHEMQNRKAILRSFIRVWEFEIVGTPYGYNTLQSLWETRALGDVALVSWGLMPSAPKPENLYKCITRCSNSIPRER